MRTLGDILRRRRLDRICYFVWWELARTGGAIQGEIGRNWALNASGRLGRCRSRTHQRAGWTARRKAGRSPTASSWVSSSVLDRDFRDRRPAGRMFVPQPAVPGHLLDLLAGRQVKAMILRSAPHRGQQSGSASYTCLMSAACLCRSARRQAQPLRASRAVVGRRSTAHCTP